MNLQVEHSKLSINSHTTQADVLSAFPGISPSWTTSNGYVWYSLPAITSKEKAVGIALCFNNDKLELVHISDINPIFGSSWDDWSLEKEGKRAVSSREWLRSHGLKADKYSSGSIWSGVDKKGGMGLAVIRFVV